MPLLNNSVYEAFKVPYTGCFPTPAGLFHKAYTELPGNCLPLRR